MKKLFYLFAALTLLCACSDNDEEDDYIWDFLPIEFRIRATDAKGNDLLEPFSEKNMEFIRGFRVKYNGEIYEPNLERILYYGKEENTSGQSRAILAFFKGLYLTYEYKVNDAKEVVPSNFYFVFGQFDGGSNYNDLTFEISWPDGQKDTVEYWREMSKLSSKNPVIKETIKVNGQKVDSFVISRQF